MSRIVSLSQAHTLMLYRLGAARSVVAIDTFGSQRPYGLEEVPRLDSFHPDGAVIKELKPDVVITSFPAQAEGLRSDDQPYSILLLEAPRGDEPMQEISRQVRVVADLVDAQERAKEIIEGFEAQLVHLTTTALPLKGASYFLELDSELFTASSSAYLAGVFNRLGFCNSADGLLDGSPDYGAPTMQQVVAADPDFYIVAHTGTPRLQLDDLAAGLRAHRTNRVVRTPVHYDRVAWAPELLDLVSDCVAQMVRRSPTDAGGTFVGESASSAVPAVASIAAPPAALTPALIASRLHDRLCLDGLDLIKPFNVGWYNKLIRELNGGGSQGPGATGLRDLPDFGRSEGDCLALLIGNTRAVWAPFSMWIRAAPETRGALRNPFDTFVRGAVERAVAAVLPAARAEYELFWACEESPGRMVAMQRAAEVSGLAYLDHDTHLAVHRIYGTWISLRAVVVCDMAGLGPGRPPPAAASLLSATERQTAAATLQLALTQSAVGSKALCEQLHGGAGVESCERAMDIKSLWIQLRDVPEVGQQYRFGEEQLDYHYTKNRKRMLDAVLGGAKSAKTTTP